MKNSQIRQLLKVAEETAVKAGMRLFKTDKSKVRIDSEKGKDIKISADKDSEKIIIRNLMKNSRFSILSEEKGMIENDVSNSVKWIIDPLDGSLNFIRGIPISCVSIALWSAKTPLLGAIYDFNKQHLFSGAINIGAKLNGKKINVSRTKNKNKAILFTGVPTKTDFSSSSMKLFATQLKEYKKVRWIGSASLSLAYVAAGWADAYMERRIMWWDVAAGIAIASSAGAEYIIDVKEDDKTCFAYASNKLLFKKEIKKMRNETCYNRR